MAPSSSNLKKNKNGGTYVNGKSLPLPLRKEIVQRFRKGERVVSIARSMKVTHGVVSKITLHYAKTGSYLPRNIQSFCDEPAPISNNAISSPSESPSSFDDSSDEYIDVVSFTPPPVNAPYSVDSILSKTAQPAVDPEPEIPNPIPINTFTSPVMPNPPMSAVPIIPPPQVAEMLQMLQLQSALFTNPSYLADFLLGNTANPNATANPVSTNPSKPTFSMNTIPMNVTMPNVQMPAVPIIPPLEMTQMAQFLQLQMLSNQFWMDPANFYRM